MTETKDPQIRVGIVLFDDVEELDFAGPWEVFGLTHKLTGGALTATTLAEREGPIRAAKGLRILADHTLDDAPPLDLVLVPGGQGTRRELHNPKLVGFLRDVAPRCRFVTSVCTGALVLHAAGFLQGKRATTHWAALHELEALGNVTLVPEARYVRDGNVVTSAGVSAGIDMALWLVGQLFDPDLARRVQRRMQYDPAPPYTAEV
jgi:transcriptional regulator GlxA family with amidase domain